jgi:hypothetical protein
MSRIKTSKVHKHSVRNTETERISKTTPLPNRRKPWNDANTDELLEGLLVEGWAFYSPDPGKAGRDFASRMGRTIEGIKCRVWKLAANDNGDGGPLIYNPLRRTNRTGRPCTINDYRIIKRALTEHAIKNGADRPSYLSKILGRDAEEMRDILSNLGGVRSRTRLDGSKAPLQSLDAGVMRARLALLIRTCPRRKDYPV